MKGRFSTVAIAAISGLVGALAIGAVVSAGADTGHAGQGTGNDITVEGPSASAGNDGTTNAFGSGNPVENDLQNDCHKAECSNSVDPASGGSGGSGGNSASGGKGGSGGGGDAASNAAVNSSGNSANTNTNTAANNTQVGVGQKTEVDNTAIAAQQQAQEADSSSTSTSTSDPNTTANGGTANAVGQQCALQIAPDCFSSGGGGEGPS